jgi:hypothetical protein
VVVDLLPSLLLVGCRDVDDTLPLQEPVRQAQIVQRRHGYGERSLSADERRPLSAEDDPDRSGPMN